MWYEVPGGASHAEREPFDSIAAAREDFDEMVKWHNDMGGAKPVAAVYHPESDYPEFMWELGPKGGVRRVSC